MKKEEHLPLKDILIKFRDCNPNFVLRNKIIDVKVLDASRIELKTSRGDTYIYNYVEDELTNMKDVSKYHVRNITEREQAWRTEFANRLSAILLEKKISIKRFAKMCSIGENTLYSYLHCKVTPTGYKIFLIAETLRIPMSYFVDFKL